MNKVDERRYIKLHRNNTRGVLRLQRTNELTRALSVDELANILVADALVARRAQGKGKK